MGVQHVWLCIPLRPYFQLLSPPLVPTLTSLLSFKHYKRAPTPGSVQQLFLQPGMFSSQQTVTWLTPSPSKFCSSTTLSGKPSVTFVLNTDTLSLFVPTVWLPSLTLLHHPLFFLFFLNWRIIALQCCVGFCHVLSHSVVSDSLQPHGLQPTSLLRTWDSPGKNTGVGCHALLQGVFPIQGLNPGFLHYRWILYCLSHQGSLKQGGKNTIIMTKKRERDSGTTPNSLQTGSQFLLLQPCFVGVAIIIFS